MGTPHPLSGSSLTNLYRIVRRHGRRIEPRHLARFARIAAAVFAATPLRAFESLRHSRAIRKQVVEPSPVMVLGHWRSGTTHLQNLLLSDEQFARVSLLHCSIPHLHLTLGRFLGGLIQNRIGSKRPMDNVTLGVHEPMSEDFGLVGRSEMTHYQSYFFPDVADAEFRRTVLFENDSQSIARWQHDYMQLLQKVTYESNGKRLCLKNPPNTGRVRHLLKLFPKAKFVFVKRNPYLVHASTCRLMEKFLNQFAFQSWNAGDIESFVSGRYELLMKRWLADRSTIPAENLIEIRHEDVVREPEEAVRAIYEQLQLCGFDDMQPALARLVESTKRYQNNRYSFEPEYLNRIAPYVQPVAELWGYSVPDVERRKAG